MTSHVASTPILPMTRTKPTANAECGRNFPSMRPSSCSALEPNCVVAATVFAARNFVPRNKRKTKVKTSIAASTRCRSKNDEKAGERNRAINHFHRSRAEADEHRPLETALRAFIDDGEIDRPDGNRGKNQRGDKTGERGEQNGMHVQHGQFAPSGSSSSSSISRRHARERLGRTKP